MAKYLRCHTGGLDISVGTVYEILREDDGRYVIIDDAGDEHLWTIEPDEEGESYRDWFVLESEEAEDLANITVLKDEALGGIEREYTEVKRKARVGERIKIVGNGYEGWGYVKGSVLTASGSVGMNGSVDYIQAEGIRVGIGDYEYVVLEPSDSIRINDVRYRMVERKAAVGERIIFDGNSNGITAGRVYDVYDADSDGGEFVDNDGDARWQDHIGAKSYVLEPLESAVQPQPSVPAESDGYASEDASLLVLQREINEAKRKLAEQAAQIDGLTGTVAKLATDLHRQGTQLKAAREAFEVIAG